MNKANLVGTDVLEGYLILGMVRMKVPGTYYTHGQLWPMRVPSTHYLTPYRIHDTSSYLLQGGPQQQLKESRASAAEQTTTHGLIELSEESVT